MNEHPSVDRRPIDRHSMDRRIFFRGLGSLGVAAVLAGCAGGGSSNGGGGGPSAAAGTVLATTGEVPVGGGVVLSEQQVVLTQPSEGEFKAFTSVCTHQQLPVTGVEDGTIECDNHGSRYDAATGEVTRGPAPAPLEEVAITVEGEDILTA